MEQYILKKEDKTISICFKSLDLWNYKKEFGSCIVDSFDFNKYNDIFNLLNEAKEIGYKIIEEPKPKLKTHNNGYKEWYLFEKLHREDGPACIGHEIEYWLINGVSHRIGGPAQTNKALKAWYKNGLCHREDGPAIEKHDGCKAWYLNDKCHREDGPAIEFVNGSKQYWIDGIQLTEEDFYKIKT